MIDAGIILIESYAEFPADVLDDLSTALDEGARAHTNVEFATETSFASDIGIRFRTITPCITSIDDKPRARRTTAEEALMSKLSRMFGGGAAFGLKEWWL